MTRTDWAFNFLLDDFILVLLIAEGGVGDEDISGCGVDAYELPEGAFPQVGHVFEGVVMDFGVLDGVAKFHVVLFGFEDGLEFFAKVYFWAKRRRSPR